MKIKFENVDTKKIFTCAVNLNNAFVGCPIARTVDDGIGDTNTVLL